jgi:aryl-alcohol dehydrogenase (NADP+)
LEYINLGNSGLKVSRICLGMMTYGSSSWRDWVLDEDQADPIIRHALESGINFFDTADMYSHGASEKITWRILQKYARRDEVVIASKVFYPTGERPNQSGLSRKHILDAIDGTLKRLGTDYVDLYQIHRWDYETPIEETLQVLDDIVRSGKVRYIGASSMWAWQFSKALHLADQSGLTRFISMQNHYNLVYREEEREMIPLCKAEKIGLIPWSPLARGFLTINQKRSGAGESTRSKSDTLAHKFYYRDVDYAILERVNELAERYNVSNAQIALAWLIQKNEITAPIIGARTKQHLNEAVNSLRVLLPGDDIAYLEEPYKPQEVLGHI